MSGKASRRVLAELPAESTAGSSHPQLVKVRLTEHGVCRCGTPLTPGSWALEIAQVPELLEPILSDSAFCSLPCVRAQFLEQLALLEGLATPVGESQVLDLRELYTHLAANFARLLAEWSGETTVPPVRGPAPSGPRRTNR